MLCRCFWAFLVVAAAVAVGPGTAATTNAASAEVFTVYMDPTGSDGNDGRTLPTAVRTLERVEGILEAADPETDVEVRIKQGTYTAGQTNWYFFLPGHTITFMPIDYEYGEGADGIAGRPVFDGDNTDGWWFRGGLRSGDQGGDTGLRFYYLKVQGYSQGGITLRGRTTGADGRRVPATAGMNRNRFFGMYFTQLGNKHTGGDSGFAAIDVVNSRDNSIRNNHFVQIENTGNQWSMHGVYFAHHSSDNVVRANRFHAISGDPVRVRNDSNDNDIFDNRFTRTGAYAHYSEWYCDAECAARNDQYVECTSHGNLFHDNDVGTGYHEDTITDWRLFPPGVDHVGAHPDCDNEGQKRLRTWNNP